MDRMLLPRGDLHGDHFMEPVQNLKNCLDSIEFDPTLVPTIKTG